MKNLIGFLVIAFAISAHAQKENYRKEKPKFTVEQRRDMAIKKMTLALDLTENQQEKIAPILLDEIKNKKEILEARREARESQKKFSADEIYQMRMNYLDRKIAVQNSMKAILDKEQFEKFKKMRHRKHAKTIEKRKKRRKNKELLD